MGLAPFIPGPAGKPGRQGWKGQRGGRTRAGPRGNAPLAHDCLCVCASTPRCGPEAVGRLCLPPRAQARRAGACVLYLVLASRALEGVCGQHRGLTSSRLRNSLRAGPPWRANPQEPGDGAMISPCPGRSPGPRRPDLAEPGPGALKAAVISPPLGMTWSAAWSGSGTGGLGGGHWRLARVSAFHGDSPC